MIDKHKLLGMIAAAEVHLDNLEFNPREFLEKLKEELKDGSQFEYPAATEGAPIFQNHSC